MTRARNPVIPLFLRSSPEHQLFSLLPCFPSPERTVKPPHQQNQVRFRSRGVRVGTHQQVAEPRLGGKRVLTDGQRDGCCCCCFPDAVGEMKGCRRRTRCSARDPTGSELPAGRAGAAGHHFSQRGFCCLCVRDGLVCLLWREHVSTWEERALRLTRRLANGRRGCVHGPAERRSGRFRLFTPF